MTKRFEGKVALVTGAGAGIGRASALAFAREGAKVVVSDRNAADGAQTVNDIARIGGESVFIAADVSRRDDIEALLAGTVETYKRLDMALNNAGIEGASFVPTAEHPEDAWDNVVRINLKGVWLSMKNEIPHLLKQKNPAIVNIASVAGLIGSRFGCAYHASKHGVIGLTKAAAIEYARQGLRVNAVAPGVIRTPMGERAFTHDPRIAEKIAATHPLGRVGTAEEVAEAVVWLCSDAASFVTGHTLAVDGGFLAQ